METQTAYDFIHNQLVVNSTIITDIAGRIYEEVAPLDAVYPFIIVSILPNTDTVGANNARCVTNLEALVYAVGLGSDMTRLIRIADAIDTVLHNNTSSQTVAITRIRPHRLSGWDQGIYYKNLGGAYAVEIGA